MDEFRQIPQGQKLADLFSLLAVISIALTTMPIREISAKTMGMIDCNLEDAQRRLEDVMRDTASLGPTARPAIETARSARTGLGYGTELTEAFQSLIAAHQPNFENRNPNELVEDVASTIKSMAHDLYAETLTVNCRLEPDVPPRLVDVIQLRTAFLHLCRNSVDALVAHRVPRPVLDICTGYTEGRTEVIISDNGPGLSPEVADILFLPFPTHDLAGVGLRLVIAKTVIDAHGGRISCTTSSAGTRYVVVL